MTKFVKRAARLALPIIAAATLAACETIKGVGRDIENTGEAIEGAIEG